MTDEPRCGTCRYWLTTGAEAVCRRKPPQGWFIAAQTVATGQLPAQTISFFPPMSEQGWCGEYARKATAPVLSLTPGDGSLAK